MMAHNIIKYSFGILKWHFQILLLPIEYDLNMQAYLPITLACLHNLILIHEPLNNISDMADSNNDSDNDSEDSYFNPWKNEAETGCGISDCSVASNICNCIAQRMWNDYQAIIHVHQSESEDKLSDGPDLSLADRMYLYLFARILDWVIHSTTVKKTHSNYFGTGWCALYKEIMNAMQESSFIIPKSSIAAEAFLMSER